MENLDSAADGIEERSKNDAIKKITIATQLIEKDLGSDHPNVLFLIGFINFLNDPTNEINSILQPKLRTIFEKCSSLSSTHIKEGIQRSIISTANSVPIDHPKDGTWATTFFSNFHAILGGEQC